MSQEVVKISHAGFVSEASRVGSVQEAFASHGTGRVVSGQELLESHGRGPATITILITVQQQCNVIRSIRHFRLHAFRTHASSQAHFFPGETSKGVGATRKTSRLLPSPRFWT